MSMHRDIVHPMLFLRLQSEHLLSEFSTAKKIRINSGTYVDALTLDFEVQLLNLNMKILIKAGGTEP